MPVCREHVLLNPCRALDSYEMNEKQLSRGRSLSRNDPQIQLKVALQSNEYLRFKNIVRNSAVDLEYVYPQPDLKTCLEMAVSNLNRIEFVKLLLENEVEVNNANETDYSAPIHLVVENGNFEALKLLLKCDGIDIDIKNINGDTALLMAIKKIGALDDDHKKDLYIYEDMIKLLLKAGCNANSPDAMGITPVHHAATLCLEIVVTHMLYYSKKSVELNAYKDNNNKTARHYLTEAFPHLVLRFDIDHLFNYLNRHDVDNFFKYLTKLAETNEHGPALAANNGVGTMLQLATDKGLERAVFTLLNFKADPNATCPANTSRPIAIACQRGYARILKMFIDNEDTLFDPVNGESLLQIAIKGMQSYSDDPKANFKKCIKLLMKDPKFYIHVNYTDLKDNTALHYAARNGDNDIVLDLLRNGACVGLRNKYNEPPLADINAKTLKTYLDECITTNIKPSHEDYEIYMEYSFLVYQNNSFKNEPCKNPLMDNSGNNYSKDFEAILASETDTLLYMARNEELKPHLKHPVISSFIYLKWQRISYFFYPNITFYSIFWLFLILYTISGHRSATLIYIGAWVCLIVLMLRELFQLLLLPARYFQSIENWMEIILIILTTWILSYNSAAESTKQQLSAIAILLSSAELVLLIGKFPTLSTNIVMLKTVSWNFLKFLLWYCILIIAFALSFYTLFRHQEIEEHDDQKAPKPDSMGNEDFFEDPGRSLFKTIVMMTGEFEAGSIKFSTFPVTSYIIFIIFVFMIPIVLFNLLNGLAVSDIQEIRADAELLGHISQIQLVCYIERQLVAYSYPSKIWSYLPEGWQRILLVVRPMYWFMEPMFYIKPLARRISLFPHYLPKYQIIVKPNQFNKTEIPHVVFRDGYENVECGGCCFKMCKTYRLDRKIVQDAKVIIAENTNVSEFEEIKARLLVTETTIKYLLILNNNTLNKVHKSTTKTNKMIIAEIKNERRRKKSKYVKIKNKKKNRKENCVKMKIK